MMEDAASFNATFTHHTTLVNDGVRLHYVIGGQGEPVLLWHGFLETWYCWRKIMPTLAEKYTIIAPDMRGYGDSEKPSSGYDARTLAEDFRTLVQQLGFRKIFIVAHDMGAPPALVYAGEYPDEVRAIAYLDEPVLTEKNMQQVHKFSPDTLKNGGLWWWAFGLSSDMPEKLISGKEREFLTWFYDNYTVARASIEPEAVEEYLRTFAAPEGISGAFGVYRAIFETIEQTEQYAKLLSKIKTPILGLGGEKSMGERTKQMLEGVASNVRGGIVPDCGHFVPDEQPNYLVEQLLAFFGEQKVS